MQNRYEEASKELEKLRAMNRYLKSSLHRQEQRVKTSISPSRSKREQKSFLTELDEDYSDQDRGELPSSARLRYAGRSRNIEEKRRYTSENDFDSTFLTSDIPNPSISRLSKHQTESRKNVSFNGGKHRNFSGSESFLNDSSLSGTRHLSKLDLEEKPHVGVSTYRPTHDSEAEDDFEFGASVETDHSPSRMNRSTQTNGRSYQSSSANNLSNSSFSSTYPRGASSSRISIPATINPHTSSTSVISAFRELQNKIKAIENERYLLNQEKDELKSRLLEMKRSSALEKNKIEIETTETLLSLRGLYEKMKKTQHDLQYQYLSQQDIQQATERKIQSQEQYYHSLQEDIIYYQEKILNFEKEKILLEKNYQESHYRAQDIEMAQRLSPQKHARQEIPVQQQITEMESAMQQTHYEQQKLQIKIDSLQAYIDVIIKINGDLCDTLVDREKAKNKFLRSLSPPPRYTWPKEIPYHDVLQVVNDTAKVHASAVLEHSAVRATEAAMNSIIQAISPTKSPKSPMSGGRRGSSKTRSGGGGGAGNSRSGSPNDFHRLASSSARTVEMTQDDEEELPIRNSPDRIQKRLENSMHRLSKARRASLRQEMGLEDDEEERGTAQASSHNQSVRSSFNHSVHFDDEPLDMQSGEEEEEEGDGRDGHYSDPGVFLGGRKTRRLKKRTLKGKGKRSLSASSGRRRSRSSSLSRRQAESIERLITRQGAINSATRFAAAATAAVNAAKVVNTPSALHSNSRHSSPGASKKKLESKVDFIPSSKPSSNEFNMIASVSKASRAAKQLNAHLASK